MVVNPDGARCRCGARGCWETEIGRDAVVRAAGLEGEQVEVADVMAAAVAGDRQAAAAVSRVGDWLGVGLANLVNLFNPEVLVLGGHLRHLLPLVSVQVTERIQAALPAAREQARIEIPALNGDSTLLGAAESAFEALLDDPVGVLTRATSAG
jgi:predicted NBD/HSP70 family sugar kinase